MRTQKWPNEFGGRILTTREGDVRMPRAKVRFETGRERGVGNALVELEEMRMTCADTKPDDFRAAFCRENSKSTERKKKRAELNREQVFAQFCFDAGFDVSEKAQGKMQLFRLEPADAAQLRIKPNEQRGDRVRQFQTNEKPFCSHRDGSRAFARFIVRRDCTVGQAREPGRSALFLARLPAGAQTVAFRSGRPR